jgi:hypothetical protein
MKKCSKCKKVKPLTDFALNRAKNDGRDYNCLVCHREYTAQHYANNKKYYKQKTYTRRDVLTQWLRDYRSKLKCEQCGEDHPACLDFHHKDRKTKEDSLYNAARRGWSIKRLLKEIEKCKVLCCKCHRILHYEERLACPADTGVGSTKPDSVRFDSSTG